MAKVRLQYFTVLPDLFGRPLGDQFAGAEDDDDVGTGHNQIDHMFDQHDPDAFLAGQPPDDFHHPVAHRRRQADNRLVKERESTHDSNTTFNITRSGDALVVVRHTSRDFAGNVGECNFTITVLDTVVIY